MRVQQADLELHIPHDQAIRRGTCRSVKELTIKIGEFIDGWNERCQPFVRTM